MTAPTPAVPNLAHMSWAVGNMLLSCLCAKLGETLAGPPCRCSLMGGDLAIADVCGKYEQGEGQAWVRMSRLFMSAEFPRPIADTFNCAGGFWVAEYELGVLRCAVGPDLDGALPSAEALNDEAAKIWDDAYALRWTAECCLPKEIRTVAGEWQPSSAGDCTGGRLLVLAELAPGTITLPGQNPGVTYG